MSTGPLAQDQLDFTQNSQFFSFYLGIYKK